MKYEEWNERLGRHFFNEDRRDQRVYLNVTEDLLCQLGSSRDAKADFVSSVRTGYKGNRKDNVCLAAAHLSGTAEPDKLPLYIGYLCLFSLAAATDGDFAAHAYYPRLCALLQVERVSGFEKVTPLWDQLEEWSYLAMEGKLGYFCPRWYVKWKHVGLPMGQSLLADEELQALPGVFASTGLDPTNIPSRGELQRVLVRHLALFRPRTIRLLRNTVADEEHARDALLDAVAAELFEWDGSSQETAATESGRSDECRSLDQLPLDERSAPANQLHLSVATPETVLNGVLRLCCNLDSAAGVAEFSFRCKLTGQIPEEGLDLTIGGEGGEEFWCDEEGIGQGWSTQIRDCREAVVSAARWDWLKGVAFADKTHSCVFRMPGREVRVLVNGATLGLPGYVECSRLVANTPLHILASHSAIDAVSTWGSEGCRGWRRIQAQGIPDTWQMFAAEEVLSDEMIRRKYPILALPKNTGIHLVGGIRVDRSEQRYFSFAPPKISVEGPLGYELWCNGVQLALMPDGLFHLPIASEFGEGTRLGLEVRRGEEIVDRRSVFIEEANQSWVQVLPSTWIGSNGRCEQLLTEPAASGARVRNLVAEPFSYVGAIPVLSWASVKFLGRRPGQVVQWPEEPLPENWVPVWLIMTRRKGQVVFCGDQASETEPSSTPTTDRRRVKLWKELIWHNRKDTEPPTSRRLRALWQEYQKVARKL